MLVGLANASISVAQPDRAVVLAALERLRTTGQPVHTDHDEGELLQRDLDQLLRSPDEELSETARRAAAPIVTQVNPPIARPSGLPYVSVSARAILKRPAPEKFQAAVAIAVDDGPFQAFCILKPGASCGKNLQEFPAAARSAGFHRLRFQAAVRHEDGTQEIRMLQPLSYGIAAATTRPIGAPDPAAFFHIAGAATARSFDASLPQISLNDWLVSLHTPQFRFSQIHWQVHWCGLGLRPELAEADMHNICAVGMMQSEPEAIVGEVWIRVGALDWRTGDPQWALGKPVFERAVLRRSRQSPLASLSAFSEALSAGIENWPAPALVVDPSDVTIDPVSTNGTSRTVLIRSAIRNDGRADAYGVSVDFTAGSADTPTMKRHFVLDIPAGQRAQVQVHVVFPPGYGWVTVQAGQTDHVVVSSVDDETNLLDRVAWRVVNPQLAPAGFAKWVGHVVCANQCRGF